LVETRGEFLMKQLLLPFQTMTNQPIIRKILIHVSAWIIYLFLFTWLLSDFRTPEEAFIRSSLFILVQCSVFYLNYSLLLPMLLEKKQYLLYITSVLFLLAVGIYIVFRIEQFLTPRELQSLIERGFPGEFPENPHQRGMQGMGRRAIANNRGFIQRMVYFNGFLILFILFISTILRNLVTGRKRERDALQLKNQLLEAETTMLKWQINPHFLFNTLNNIFAMSKLKLDSTPDAIHRLSTMLRYVIYDCNRDKVALDQEITYLKSYVELQRLKEDFGDRVTYDFPESDLSLPVAPLLFIAFVENSFKHSRIEDTPGSWIRISMKTEGTRIFFGCSNSIPQIRPAGGLSRGIGLENVRKRLGLLYPGQYSLEIKEENSTFTVDLTIDTYADPLPDRG